MSKPSPKVNIGDRLFYRNGTGELGATVIKLLSNRVQIRWDRYGFLSKIWLSSIDGKHFVLGTR